MGNLVILILAFSSLRNKYHIKFLSHSLRIAIQWGVGEGGRALLKGIEVQKCKDIMLTHLHGFQLFRNHFFQLYEQNRINLLNLK